MADGRDFTVRVADERDMPALARLRRAWLEERAGHPVDAPGFEAAFAEWWRVELPRRTFWLAEVGSERSGFTAIGSINVVEIVHMPRPGARPGRIGHIGNAFVLASFADRGVPAALLTRGGRARPRAPLPQPAARPHRGQHRVLPARGVQPGGRVAAGDGPGHLTLRLWG